MANKVLVTGATGFVGHKLCARLLEAGDEVIGLGRSCQKTVFCGASYHQLNLETDDLAGVFAEGVDCVVHLAAQAHGKGGSKKQQLDGFRRANVEVSLKLARLAIDAGVRRFIFISSIGVNGNWNMAPFTEHHIPQPVEPYAHSKWEAEEGLKALAEETGMELVIIRPPLVYGPDAPGNFGLLTKVATSGLLLPLAGIRNRRSFVSVWNLVDFIAHCIEHSKAAGQTFVVADGEDVSTTELLCKLARAAGKPSRLFWLPAPLLKAGAMAMGKRGVCDRLFDSLQVDASHARRTLDWVPPLSLDEGLRLCFCPQDEGPIS